jgi:hypothetical protein
VSVLRAVAAVAACVALAAGCGGGDDAGAEPDPPPSAPSPGEAEPESVASPPSLAEQLTPACAAELLETAGSSGYGSVALRCLKEIDRWAETVAPIERFLAAGVALSELPTAEVRCDPPASWRADPQLARVHPADVTGFVREGTHEIHLAPATCLSLEQLMRTRSLPCLVGNGGCDGSEDETAAALVTVMHEMEHLVDVDDEAIAQCYALQHVDLLALELGLPVAEAAVLGRHVQALDWSADWYTSPECRAGGDLDVEEESPAFP